MRSTYNARRNTTGHGANTGAIIFPFSRGKVGNFVQDQPLHENAFSSDPFLIQNLKRLIPKDMFSAIEPDLNSFGRRVSTDIWRLGQECAINEPYLNQTTAWGQKVDEIVTCDAWKQQKRISAEEGLIAIAYERKFAEFSRLYQMVKLFLYSPASGLYSCPLAMTDGAAKTIESNGLVDSQHEPFSHLTSRDPDKFWTSGQWMTEKRGGSDVAEGTETVAVAHESGDNQYRLYGYKWFSSASDSDMTLTLARVVNPEGTFTPGTKGISMFLLRTRDSRGCLNGLEVVKLKNKLGTRQLPTAELLIDGAVAEKISVDGRGIASISTMLAVSRLHNVISSVSGPRKLLSLARDYATRRHAFGRSISKHPLHLQTLSRMETEVRGCTVLLLDLALKIGLDDCKKISDEDALLLRVMTPVAKMYTAKKAVQLTSEGLECFGGQGYIEDTGLPGFLRDAQVLPIWEGTSSVISLDVLRAMKNSNGEALLAFKSHVLQICKESSSDTELKGFCEQIEKSLEGIVGFVMNCSSKLETAARDFTVSLAQIYIAALLMEHARFSRVSNDASRGMAVFTLQQWMLRDLAPVLSRNNMGAFDVDSQSHSAFIYEGYDADNLLEPTFTR